MRTKLTYTGVWDHIDNTLTLKAPGGGILFTLQAKDRQDAIDKAEAKHFHQFGFWLTNPLTGMKSTFFQFRNPLTEK